MPSQKRHNRRHRKTHTGTAKKRNDACAAKCDKMAATLKSKGQYVDIVNNMNKNCKKNCQTPQTPAQKNTCKVEIKKINKIVYDETSKKLVKAMKTNLIKLEKEQQELQKKKGKINSNMFDSEIEKNDQQIKSLKKSIADIENPKKKNNKTSDKLVEHQCDPKEPAFSGYLGNSAAEEKEWYKYTKQKRLKEQGCFIM